MSFGDVATQPQEISGAHRFVKAEAHLRECTWCQNMPRTQLQELSLAYALKHHSAQQSLRAEPSV